LKAYLFKAVGIRRKVPVQVKGAGGSGYLSNIKGIAAGRSGEYSLAYDDSDNAYGWGKNEYGQLGNGKSGNVKIKDKR